MGRFYRFSWGPRKAQSIPISNSHVPGEVRRHTSQKVHKNQHSNRTYSSKNTTLSKERILPNGRVTLSSFNLESTLARISRQSSMARSFALKSCTILRSRPLSIRSVITCAVPGSGKTLSIIAMRDRPALRAGTRLERILTASSKDQLCKIWRRR